MKVIKPKAISLKSTNVAANTESEWSAATNYSYGAMVKVTTATPNKVYQSLRGNNVNRSPADYLKPKVETSTSSTSLLVGLGLKTLTVATGEGYSAGMTVKISKTVTPQSVNMTGEVTSYNTGTGELVVNVYAITGEGTHSGWSIASTDEIGFWKEASSTNQWAMFDAFVNTQTISATDITFKLNVSGADHIVLLGLLGVSVEITLKNADETETFWTKTVDLIYGSSLVSNVSNWYEYFFGIFSYRTDVSEYMDVLAENATLVVTVKALDEDGAACGSCLVGRSLDTGKTQYGVRVGMVDFSSRDEDDEGRVTVKQGYWAKRNTIPVNIDNVKLDYIYKEITALRGTPTAWIGNGDGTDYEALIIYGIIKDFEITIPGPRKSLCTFDIEGLI